MALRYYWAELKKEYFASEFVDLAAWRKHTKSRVPPYNNSSFRKNTKGWCAEKLEWEKNKVHRTIQKMLEKESEANAKALINLLKHFQTLVGAESSLNRMTVKEKAELWKIWRIENKLPISISSDLFGEDPENRFTSLSDILKAARGEQKEEQ